MTLSSFFLLDSPPYVSLYVSFMIFVFGLLEIQQTIQEKPTLQQPAAQKGCQVLLALLELNLHHLRKEDTEGYVETIKELLKGCIIPYVPQTEELLESFNSIFNAKLIIRI